MATVVQRTERPRTDDRPAPTVDLAGRYRVVHGDLIVPLPVPERDKAVAAGLPPFESLYIGSVVELTHAEADRLLDHGVVEPETPPRKGQVELAKAKAKATARPS